MPETEEEVLSILHEFDDRVRAMEKMLYEIDQKEILKDVITDIIGKQI